MIGDIASYCQQREYANFSMSNRTIYIACNKPNYLRQLMLKNHASADLPQSIWRYASIESLAISVAYKYGSDYWNMSNQDHKFAKLTRLFLHGKKDHNVDCHIVHSLLQPDDSMINPNLIRHLGIYSFGVLSCKQLLDILKLCPNLDYLYIQDTKIIGFDKDFENNINDFALDLKGFGIFCNDSKLTNILIKKHGNNICTLGVVNEIFIPECINFNNLSELYLYRSNSQSLQMILEKSHMLKSITLQKHDQDIWKVIPSIFIKQRKLQSLTIIENRYSDWDNITDSIERAIYQCNHYESQNLQKYSQIRIALLFWVPSQNIPSSKPSAQPTLDEIFMKLTRIINEISLFSFTVDFVFKIEFCGRFDGDLDAQCNLFRKKYNDIDLQSFTAKQNNMFCDDMDLIIYNKSNCMNGWSDGDTNVMSF